MLVRDRFLQVGLCLIVTSSVLANGDASWTQYATDMSKDKLFYKTGSAKKQGHLRFVWHRVQYADPTKYGDLSVSTYYKIDCQQDTIQFLSTTFYSDKYWKIKNWEGKRGQENSIRKNSSDHELRNIVCSE